MTLNFYLKVIHNIHWNIMVYFSGIIIYFYIYSFLWTCFSLIILLILNHVMFDNCPKYVKMMRHVPWYWHDSVKYLNIYFMAQVWDILFFMLLMSAKCIIDLFYAYMIDMNLKFDPIKFLHPIRYSSVIFKTILFLPPYLVLLFRFYESTYHSFSYFLVLWN